jgi:hypothetical protein
VRIQPRDQSRYDGDHRFINRFKSQDIRYATLGAGPDESDSLAKVYEGKSTLVSDINRPKDVRLNSKVEQVVLNLNGREEDEVIAALFAADVAYSDDLRYELRPEAKNDAFNSNSYISGLLQAIGLDAPELKSNVPGYNKPVPLEHFRNEREEQ